MIVPQNANCYNTTATLFVLLSDLGKETRAPKSKPLYLLKLPSYELKYYSRSLCKELIPETKLKVLFKPWNSQER